jgi:3-oxoacyl-[acyl-carrier-protein] synthase III
MPRPTQPRGATVVGTGSYVPERVLTNADFERMVETSDEWIVTRTGIRERHVVRPGQASCDLAETAARRALEMAGMSAEDVDLILVATLTPDRFLPSAACTLQDRLGAKHAWAFDLNAACSGFVYGIPVAASLIAAGQADTVLLIGVETLSSVTDYQDRATCVLFGDGAGAVVMRPCDPGKGVLAHRLGSDGSQGAMLEIPAGGSREPASHATVDARGHFIKMKGNELFKFAVRAMESVARQALADAGADLKDLKFLIPHQANLRIINAIADRLEVKPEQLVVNVDRYGNTSSASIPISLDELVRGGRSKPGDLIELVAFGGGVTWGAVLMEWNPTCAYPLVPRAGADRAGERGPQPVVAAGAGGGA